MLTLVAALLVLHQDDPLLVEVLEVKGSVEFKAAGKEAKWEPLKPGAKLARGTMVQTGLKSHAVLRWGQSTRVLVRPSTFAVITEAFAQRNEVKGELRVDVGSIHLDADKDRDEKLEFKVTTPQGTAAVRGTRLSLRTSDVGLEAVGESGVTDLNTIYGNEYRLGEHLRSLLSSIATDLAAMADAARRTPLADDNLSDGDRSWATKAFNPGSEANTIGMRVHGAGFCMPSVDVGFNEATTRFDCGLFYRWEMVWNLDGYFWESVKGKSKIASVFYESGKNEYWLMLHGRTVYVLREILAGTEWALQMRGGGDFYEWDATTQTWRRP
jgi:hypothetical protein